MIEINMIKVLMIGPARNVKGGMTTVIDNYFQYGLDKKVDLKYIETINDKSKISKFFKEIKGFIEFKKYVKDYNIIHIHMASRRSTFRKIKYIKSAKKYNKKVIVHFHGGGFKKFFEEECDENKRNLIKKWIEQIDVLIVLSEEWKEYFEKNFNCKTIKIIYNGVNIPKLIEKKANNELIFLGRINKNKGIYDLIEALNIINKNNIKFTLHICGSGEEEKLKEKIKEYNLEKSIILEGWIDSEKRDEILRQASIFVLPSYFEAMPVSVLEAMSYKNIVISTNVGGIPKIITDRKNGYLINPGNISELASTIEYVINNIDNLKKISDNARETIENNFNIKNNIDKTYDIYNKLSRNGEI